MQLDLQSILIEEVVHIYSTRPAVCLEINFALAKLKQDFFVLLAIFSLCFQTKRTGVIVHDVMIQTKDQRLKDQVSIKFYKNHELCTIGKKLSFVK